MIYTDEDVVVDGGQIELISKPGWSPEHMAALMYTCHLGVYRRDRSRSSSAGFALGSTAARTTTSCCG